MCREPTSTVREETDGKGTPTRGTSPAVHFTRREARGNGTAATPSPRPDRPNTLHFENEDEDDLRRVGMSKEHRVDPQVQVGLLVDPSGFPLEVHLFEGNAAETKTLVPVLASFQARHGVADMVVVADAGMLSARRPAQVAVHPLPGHPLRWRCRQAPPEFATPTIGTVGSVTLGRVPKTAGMLRGRLSGFWISWW